MAIPKSKGQTPHGLIAHAGRHRRSPLQTTMEPKCSSLVLELGLLRVGELAPRGAEGLAHLVEGHARVGLDDLGALGLAEDHVRASPGALALPPALALALALALARRGRGRGG